MAVRAARMIRREPSGRVLLSGGRALARAALAAGCGAYFCHPLSPDGGLDGAMSAGLAAAGGVHLAASSPEEALAMLAGAAAGGARALIACSGPGLSRMQEGISHLCALELPRGDRRVQPGRAGPGQLRPLPGRLPAGHPGRSRRTAAAWSWPPGRCRN